MDRHRLADLVGQASQKMAVITMATNPPPEVEQMARHAIEALGSVIASTEAEPEAVINQVITDMQALANLGTGTNVEHLAVDAADLLGKALGVLLYLREYEDLRRLYNLNLYALLEERAGVVDDADYECQRRIEDLRYNLEQDVSRLHAEYFGEGDGTAV
jgi:hypothetical protein